MVRLKTRPQHSESSIPGDVQWSNFKQAMSLSIKWVTFFSVQSSVK